MFIWMESSDIHVMSYSDARVLAFLNLCFGSILASCIFLVSIFICSPTFQFA